MKKECVALSGVDIDYRVWQGIGLGSEIDI
jgi:hypothetical protein